MITNPHKIIASKRSSRQKEAADQVSCFGLYSTTKSKYLSSTETSVSVYCIFSIHFIALQLKIGFLILRFLNGKSVIGHSIAMRFLCLHCVGKCRGQEDRFTEEFNSYLKFKRDRAIFFLQNLAYFHRMTSHEFRGFWNYWQLECLLNSLLKLSPRKPWKVHITCPLWGSFTVDWWIPSTEGRWAESASIL